MIRKSPKARLLSLFPFLHSLSLRLFPLSLYHATFVVALVLQNMILRTQRSVLQTNLAPYEHHHATASSILRVNILLEQELYGHKHHTESPQSFKQESYEHQNSTGNLQFFKQAFYEHKHPASTSILRTTFSPSRKQKRGGKERKRIF